MFKTYSCPGGRLLVAGRDHVQALDGESALRSEEIPGFDGQLALPYGFGLHQVQRGCRSKGNA